MEKFVAASRRRQESKEKKDGMQGWTAAKSEVDVEKSNSTESDVAMNGFAEVERNNGNEQSIQSKPNIGTSDHELLLATSRLEITMAKLREDIKKFTEYHSSKIEEHNSKSSDIVQAHIREQADITESLSTMMQDMNVMIQKIATRQGKMQKLKPLSKNTAPRAPSPVKHTNFQEPNVKGPPSHLVD